MGCPIEGGGEALLLGLPVVIGKVELGGVVDPTFEDEGSGDDIPASVKVGGVKTILVELDEGWISYYFSF